VIFKKIGPSPYFWPFFNLFFKFNFAGCTMRNWMSDLKSRRVSNGPEGSNNVSARPAMLDSLVRIAPLVTSVATAAGEGNLNVWPASATATRPLAKSMT
jgi:hypothetical protein